MESVDTLPNLGWRPFFESQFATGGDGAQVAARVVAVHRNRVRLIGPGVPDSVPAIPGVTVGDWVVIDCERERIARVLDRFAVFKRRSAGTEAVTQLIAANVDTLFIVTSANRDFNVARLERYLALAHDAGAYPIIVITKADIADAVDAFVSAASRLASGLLVEALDARDSAAVDVLRSWCGPGQTVALLGSSGVGKSTLINSLAGTNQQTRQVREDDQRGRHTTTGRSMHPLPSGGWLIDTPGMRELQLVDVGRSLDDVFAEIAELSAHCRFADCAHDAEPGCAVRAAIDDGRLEEERLKRYRKLKREDRRNSESVAERHSRDRHFGKLYKAIQTDRRHRKGGKN